MLGSNFCAAPPCQENSVDVVIIFSSCGVMQQLLFLLQQGRCENTAHFQETTRQQTRTAGTRHQPLRWLSTLMHR